MVHQFLYTLFRQILLDLSFFQFLLLIKARHAHFHDPQQTLESMFYWYTRVILRYSLSQSERHRHLFFLQQQTSPVLLNLLQPSTLRTHLILLLHPDLYPWLPQPDLYLQVLFH